MINFLRMVGRLTVMIAPWPLRRWMLRRVWGYKIGENARIGCSYVYPEILDLREGATIGHLSFISGMDELHLGAAAKIGNLNWITGFPRAKRPQGFAKRTSLSLGQGSAVTNRHYIDVQDVICVGRFSTIAGIRSVLLTHGIDYRTCRQVSSGVTIGDYALVSTNVVILPGACIGSKVILGAGAVVTKGEHPGPALYVGTPAKFKTDLPDDCLYFVRTSGPVG